jgi:hypothetical protein
VQNRNGTDASHLHNNGGDVERRVSPYQPFLDPLEQCPPINTAGADFTGGVLTGSSRKAESTARRKGRRRSTPKEQVILDLLDLMRRTTFDERTTL